MALLRVAERVAEPKRDAVKFPAEFVLSSADRIIVVAS
jgi:hypothetical protein